VRTPDVSRLTGATYRQLDYWARQGYIRPSLGAAAGSGTQREYSRADVAAVARIKVCLDAGLTVTAAVRVARGESGTRRRTGLGWPGERDVWLSDRVRVSMT
jgi:DNA-binding transcriptional MerR regulator